MPDRLVVAVSESFVLAVFNIVDSFMLAELLYAVRGSVVVYQVQ
jgi:hypothetical protein